MKSNVIGATFRGFEIGRPKSPSVLSIPKDPIRVRLGESHVTFAVRKLLNRPGLTS